jgi:hypothetical protein
VPSLAAAAMAGGYNSQMVCTRDWKRRIFLAVLWPVFLASEQECSAGDATHARNGRCPRGGVWSRLGVSGAAGVGVATQDEVLSTSKIRRFLTEVMKWIVDMGTLSVSSDQ